MATKHSTDFVVTNHGSIFLFRPLTEAAETFLAETAPEDAQFLGSAMAVEHRFVLGVIDAIQDAGLEVK